MQARKPATPAGAAVVFEALRELHGYALRDDRDEKRAQVMGLFEQANGELVNLERRADIAEEAYELLQHRWVEALPSDGFTPEELETAALRLIQRANRLGPVGAAALESGDDGVALLDREPVKIETDLAQHLGHFEVAGPGAPPLEHPAIPLLGDLPTVPAFVNEAHVPPGSGDPHRHEEAVRAPVPIALQGAGDLTESEGFEPPNGCPSPDFEKSGLHARPPRGSTTAGEPSTPPRSFYEDVFTSATGSAELLQACGAETPEELEQLGAGDVGRACRGCGCTESNACVVLDGTVELGCSWTRVDPTICDACVFPSTRVRGPLDPLEQLAGDGEVLP